MISIIKHYTPKVTNLCPKINKVLVNNHMSTHKVRYPDKNATGQAATNNPPIKKNGIIIQHSEITRQECAKPECKDVICPQLCGPLVKETSVANLTTGTPATPHGTTVTLDNVTADGRSKTQYAHMYKKAHDTDPNQKEIPAGTAFVKKPNVESIINHYEEKK